MITLYLIGHFRLPHDTPVDKVGPVRVLFSVGFLAFGFWLLTGLFGGKLGFLEGMIPMPGVNSATAMYSAPANGLGPGETGGTSTASASPASKPAEEQWVMDNYGKALEMSRATGKPMFVDFTGYNCGNCRLMERNMFTRGDVADLMNRYILVRLYTDNGDSVNKHNQNLQLTRFKTVALPYYALISPNDSTIAEFGGMTTEPAKFISFLQRGLEQKPIAMR
jgi:thiol:disulfide interchange protein DsbD